MKGATAGLALSLILPAAATGKAGEQLEEGIRLYKECAAAEARAVLLGVVSAFPDDAEALFYLARSWLLEDGWEEAIDSIEAALAMDPGNSTYHQVLGQALGLKARSISNPFTRFSTARRARAEFAEAVELDPENLSARMNLLQYYARAPGIAGGSRANARAQAEEIRRRDESEGREGFAIIHRYAKAPAAAEAEYRAAIQADRDNRSARIGLGRLLLDEDRVQDARQVFEHTLEIDSGNRQALFYIGEVAARTGEQIARGIEALESYLAGRRCLNEPSESEALFLLGRLLEDEGEVERARSCYRAALDKNPSHKKAKKALRRLSSVRTPSA